MIEKELRHQSYKYTKYSKINNEFGLPKSSKEMIDNVAICLTEGNYPVYRYEINFIKGSENQTLVEVNMPNCPSLENLLSCIKKHGTYGNIALKVCRDKYNSRHPFENDDKLNSYQINLRYTRGHSGSIPFVGDMDLVEKFNHIEVSQAQCTITKEAAVYEHTYKMDWLIIIPGVYPEPPEKPNYFIPGVGFKITGYEITDEMNKMLPKDNS